MTHGTSPITRIELPVRGPFSLAASIRFLEGFAPATGTGTGAGPADELTLAFPVEGDWRAVGARVCEHGGTVVAEVHGEADPARVRAQLARLLSVDVDGTGWPAVGERDPVVGALQRRFAGLRPVGFWSPYEAAAWSVLSTRSRMTQAAAVKARLAAEHGARVRVGDRELAAFPAPAVLRELPAAAGVPERKLAWLRAIAAAALEGRLDGDRLRALPPDEALADLTALPGIGPFGAELVLARGASHPDRFPERERRLHAAMAAAYGVDAGDLGALRAIAERWRPYRTWAALHLRAAAEPPA